MEGLQEFSGAPDPPEIVRAVRALQAGASSAHFEPIYRAHYRQLYTFFARRPLLAELADDLTQDTLLRAGQNIRTYDFRSPLGAWLWRIAENVWKNAVRDQKTQRRGGFLEALEPNQDDSGAVFQPQESVLAPAAPDPEQVAIVSERKQALGDALAVLPIGMRRVATLRFGQGLEYEEIAAALKINSGTVRSQLSEATKRLKKRLRFFADVETSR